MNWGSALLWGFAATVVLTVIEAGSRGLGWTRASTPFLLGTMLTPDRDRANLYGVMFHFMFGLLFSLIYMAFFESLQRATWWLGLCMGFAHGSLILTIVLPYLPSMHPRMAREGQGPESISLIQPPGFLGLHYGWATSLVVMLAHCAYGLTLGWGYVIDG